MSYGFFGDLREVSHFYRGRSSTPTAFSVREASIRLSRRAVRRAGRGIHLSPVLVGHAYVPDFGLTLGSHVKTRRPARLCECASRNKIVRRQVPMLSPPWHHTAGLTCAMPGNDDHMRVWMVQVRPLLVSRCGDHDPPAQAGVVSGGACPCGRDAATTTGANSAKSSHYGTHPHHR